MSDLPSSDFRPTLGAMKWVPVWIAALLLGAAMGWRGDVEVSEGAGLDKVEPPSALPSVADVQRAADLGAKAFGKGWRSWAERVRTAKSSADLEALIDPVAAIEDQRLKATMFRLLGARWAELDPEAGVRYLKGVGLRTWVLPELMTEWVLRDPDAGLEELKRHIHPAGSQVPDWVQERLSLRNPEMALRMIRALGRYAHYPKSGLKELAAAYPGELAALIVEIETDSLAQGGRYHAYNYLRAAARELTVRDPRAALKWADGLEGRMRDTARRAVTDRWEKIDPLGFAKHLEESGAKIHHDFDNDLKNAMAGDDFDKIIALAETRGSADRSLSIVLAKQIENGSLSFGQVYDRVSRIETNGGSVRFALFRGLWTGMSGAEMGEALQLLHSRPAGAGRTTAMEALIRNWKARDPEAAVAGMVSLPAGEARDTIAASLLTLSDLGHSARPVENVIGMLPVEDRAAAIGGLLEVVPGEDIPAGFDPAFLAEALAVTPQGAARDLAIERLGVFWGSFDPAWAMEWATGLAGGESARAAAGVAKGWAPHDLYSLSNALLELPPGVARDSATVVLVEALNTDDPDAALEWAGQIGNPVERERVIEAMREER